MQKFKELGLNEETISALNKKGFEEPTEIQSKIIPHLLSDKGDVIGQAQTGTGKTAAFALPLIERLDKNTKDVQVIILAPTRELAIQVCEEINSLMGEQHLRAIPIYGGQSIELQLTRLKKGASFVVGTPGRVIDHLRRGSLKLDKVSYFILDEADEMLNMGFIEDVEEILDKAPQKKRILLFSATMPTRIKLLAENYMDSKYVHIKTKTKLTVELTNQIYFEVEQRDKFEALSRIIDIEHDFYGLVFCRTRRGVDELAGKLLDRGYNSEGLHGEISQAQRERILGKFRKRQITILAATDVAARGIDVIDLTHVINYSIPQNPEAYIHRIGRTGRAGKKGTAITFITPAEFRKLSFIKKITEADIKKMAVPDINEIIGVRKKRITDIILNDVKDGVDKKFRKWASQLLSKADSEEIVASILKNSYSDVMDTNTYNEIAVKSRGKKNTRGKTAVETEGTTRLFIARGKKDKLTKRDLVDFIVNKAGTPAKLIDQVQLCDSFSFITVPFAEAEIILQKFKSGDDGKRPVVEKANTKKSKQSPGGKARSGKGSRPMGRKPGSGKSNRKKKRS
ncbi:DEAD/DEAH box helicase [Elusimicrobiota bacterium]